MTVYKEKGANVVSIVSTSIVIIIIITQGVSPAEVQANLADICDFRSGLLN